jgi:hypothetical protein
MAAAVLYLTQYQAVSLAGFNLTALRLLELAGTARVVFRREFSSIKPGQVDRLFLVMNCYVALVFLLRSSSGHAEVIGTTIDAILLYFIFRSLLRDMEDMIWFLRNLVIILAPYLALIWIEVTTQSNPFSLLGASTWNFEIRGERIRAMGSFRHPSLLGSLGACLLPLYIAMMFIPRTRQRAAFGIALCLGIVVFANSGGPVSATVAGLLGWLTWILRKHMHAVRRCLLALLVALALVMKAPIWYLPARVSLLSGGGGWHRSYLMDVAFQNLDQWWFAGMDLAQTRHWFPYVVGATGAADITNAYLYFGIKAGLAAIVLFVLLLATAYRHLGEGLKQSRAAPAANRAVEYMLWGLGCALLVHIVTWFGITYFDQFEAIWLLQLAAISAMLQASAYPRSVDTPRPGRGLAHVSTQEVDSDSGSSGRYFRG